MHETGPDPKSHLLKKSSLLILILCLSITPIESIARCDTEPTMEDVEKWSNQIKNGSIDINKVLDCSGVAWVHGDGAIRWEISDFYLESLLHDHEAFMDFMSAHDGLFREWIKDLDRLSFTWYKEAPSPLEGKKRKIISFLENLNCPKHLSIKNALLQRLRTIKIRQID